MKTTYDFAVIGAGVFGAWTAYLLRRSGASVVLLDSHGAANSRASSGGETRVIRMGYGPDELYTRWSIQSLPAWGEFEARCGTRIFHRTGVLWLGHDSDPYTAGLWDVMQRHGVDCEKLSAEDVRKRYPQMTFPDITWAVLEPQSGLLMARRSVQLLVHEAIKSGVTFQQVAAFAPQTPGGANSTRSAFLKTGTGETISAGNLIYACGPWLPALFPQLLGDRIFPTRQEIFFLGPPAGSLDYQPPRMPVWLHHTHAERPYALPDIENRGFKIAFDRHGPEFDPETGSRVVEESSLGVLREYLATHIPGLAQAPILESRVCQYENTWNGDFLIDRHPDYDNVWIVGGGSGHGFKHGPAVGEYVCARVLKDAPAEPRFSLASKQSMRARAVF